MESSGVTNKDYGRRLIPHLIDDTAREDPHREAFLFPRTDQPKDGWASITFKDYANAINRCAWVIIEAFGESSKDTFPTIAYIGPQDARYVVMVFAAVKAGYRALYISPRNSDQGQLNLFEKANCNILTYASNYRATVQPWLQQRAMKALEVKSFEEWFSPEEVPHFPYKKTFEQAEWEPLCVLHTSGSTGLPKPVVATHGMLAISDALHHQPDWEGYTHWVPAWAERAKRFFMPMPLFHSGALYGFIFYAIYWDTPVAFGIPDKALTSDLAMECLDNLDVQATVLPPSILEEMSLNSQSITTLRQLKVVAFGGGNLATEAGEILVKNQVPLQTTMNTTEFSPYPVYFQPEPQLWNYFIFNADMLGCDWREVYDNVYELVVRRKDPNHPGLQGFFYTFPELQEYNTKDLYKPHPNLTHHWTYYGRADNIIVFSNGEKLNPVTIEDTVQSHRQIKGALVVGSGRFQAGLLLEPSIPAKNEDEKSELVNSIWPLVERANSETVGHGRIGRNYIAVTDEAFLRAGKGTVQRILTVNKLSDEIDKLYQKAEQVPASEVPSLDVSSVESLADSIKGVLEADRDGLQLERDTNIFSVGVDSRQTINTARLLRAGLEAVGYTAETVSLDPRIIYNNPTCRRLAEYVFRSLSQPGRGDESEKRRKEHEIDVMKDLYARYIQDPIRADSKRPDISGESQTIVLTGSTGMLGSYILDQLVHNPGVARVICLNRAADGGQAQQAESMAKRQLAGDYPEKTEFYHTDVSRAALGLPQAIYSRLLNEADRIIHCAWLVNFNFMTEAFEAHVRGVRRLADLAAAARKRVAVILVSSVSVAGQWDPTNGAVPEAAITDWHLPADSGYGRSKMVGSLVLDAAATAGDFPAATIRLGQIAGPEAHAGMWSRGDWLPSIVASSLHMGVLPRDLGASDHVDWLPAERAAALVLDIANAPPGEINGYFHGVNPSPVAWRDLAPSVQKFYGSRIKSLVNFDDWVAQLEKSDGDQRGYTGAVDVNPGLKLLDTYRAMSRGSGSPPIIFDTRRTSRISAHIRNVKSITPSLMEHWCAQWDFQGAAL